jgi:Uma2 family endonuclease
MTDPADPLDLAHAGEAWPAQGSWTYEDYLRLPADRRRCEVISGTLYAIPAPGYDHQHTVWQLGRLLGSFVAGQELGVVLGAPFEVRLPGGLGDPVQPDVVVLRRAHQPQPGDLRFEGVPDLIVEVSSGSHRSFDRTVKLPAYREAQVPEVWLVDPAARTVEVFAPGDHRLLERGETVASAVLADLRMPVSELFAHRTR